MVFQERSNINIKMVITNLNMQFLRYQASTACSSKEYMNEPVNPQSQYNDMSGPLTHLQNIAVQILARPTKCIVLRPFFRFHFYFISKYLSKIGCRSFQNVYDFSKQKMSYFICYQKKHLNIIIFSIPSKEKKKFNEGDLFQLLIEKYMILSSNLVGTFRINSIYLHLNCIYLGLDTRKTCSTFDRLLLVLIQRRFCSF